MANIDINSIIMSYPGAIPMTNEDQLRAIQGQIRDGYVLVRADDPAYMTWFEDKFYPPNTEDNIDFTLYTTTRFVPSMTDIIFYQCGTAHKNPKLRAYFGSKDDDWFKRLYKINIEADGVHTWAWKKSVDEAVADVTDGFHKVMRLEDVKALRFY